MNKKQYNELRSVQDYRTALISGSLCKCGHGAKLHLHGKSCGFEYPVTFKFCKCEFFNLKGENEMAKEKKEKVAPKESPAKLAGFVDSPFPIYLVMGKKEREARVLSSGLIRFKEEEFKSPCAAATAMAKDMDEKWVLNAWTALKYNKDGERVALDTIRGAKSPLKAAPAPKAKTVKKAKRVRKARKEAPAATYREAVQEQSASA